MVFVSFCPLFFFSFIPNSIKSKDCFQAQKSLVLLELVCWGTQLCFHFLLFDIIFSTPEFFMKMVSILFSMCLFSLILLNFLSVFSCISLSFLTFMILDYFADILLVFGGGTVAKNVFPWDVTLYPLYVCFLHTDLLIWKLMNLYPCCTMFFIPKSFSWIRDVGWSVSVKLPWLWFQVAIRV